MEAVKSMSHLTYQNTSCPLVDFSAKLRKALEQVEEPRQYACFDVILKDSTVPEGVIILHKGEITISVAMGAKRRISTHNVHTGQILGLASVLSGLPSMATAQCKTDCVTGYIPAKQLMAILGKNSDLCLELSSKFSADVLCATLKVKSLK